MFLFLVLGHFYDFSTFAYVCPLIGCYLLEYKYDSLILISKNVLNVVEKMTIYSRYPRNSVFYPLTHKYCQTIEEWLGLGVTLPRQGKWVMGANSVKTTGLEFLNAWCTEKKTAYNIRRTIVYLRFYSYKWRRRSMMPVPYCTKLMRTLQEYIGKQKE